MARLGHAVCLDHGHAVARLGLAHQLGRERRAARAREAQRPGRVARLVEDHAVERRPGREPGDAVGRGLGPEAPRAEPARNDDRPAGGELRQRRCDQAVDVEERHRAVRDVIRRERVVAGDRLGLGGQVALQERHLLGARRRAARVQEERGVVRTTASGRAAGGRPDVGEQARRRVRLPRGELDDPRALGGRPGRGRRAGWDEQQPRLQVVEEEAILGLGVGRVERRHGRAERRQGEQRRDELRPVGKHDGDPVAAVDAGRRELGRQAGCRSAELRVRDGRAVVGCDERRPRALGVDQREQRAGGHRSGHPLGDLTAGGHPDVARAGARGR